MDENSGQGKGLWRIIALGTSVSFGILGAIIASMRDFVGGNAVFDFSYRTLIGFGLGALIGWLMWRGLRLWIERTERPGSNRRRSTRL